MVRPCVLRHRVPVITLCPLGEPEIAIGHEPRIEPRLPKSNRLPSFKSRRTLSPLENETKGMEEQSREEPLERSRAICKQWAGYRDRKFLGYRPREKLFCFYLRLRLLMVSGFHNSIPGPSVRAGSMPPNQRSIRKTSLPTVWRFSSRRCASAASARGNTLPIRGFSQPPCTPSNAALARLRISSRVLMKFPRPPPEIATDLAISAAGRIESGGPLDQP